MFLTYKCFFPCIHDLYRINRKLFQRKNAFKTPKESKKCYKNVILIYLIACCIQTCNRQICSEQKTYLNRYTDVCLYTYKPKSSCM